MLTSIEPDIFLVCESLLNSDINPSEFLPAPYTVSGPFRKDRVRGGGGVFIATREHIIAEPLPSLNSNCEICWVRIRLQSNQYIIVGVFYTPKAATESFDELRKSLETLREKFPGTPIFLGGDFNLPGIDWESNSHIQNQPKKQQSELLVEIAADFHLEQVNLEPTRQQNILELLFTSSPETVLSCSTGPGISDHNHLVIARVNLKPKHQRKKPRTIFLFKKADWPKIKDHLNDAKKTFMDMSSTESTENLWCFLRDTIHYTMR